MESDISLYLVLGYVGTSVLCFALFFFIGRYIWEEKLTCGHPYCPRADSRVSKHSRWHFVLQSINVLLFIIAVVSGAGGYIGLMRWAGDTYGGWGLLVSFVLTVWVCVTGVIWAFRDR